MSFSTKLKKNHYYMIKVYNIEWHIQSVKNSINNINKSHICRMNLFYTSIKNNPPFCRFSASFSFTLPL